VKDDIRRHLVRAVSESEESYASAAEDEDTMTGHLGAKLEARNRRVLVQDAEIRGEWKWSLQYYKFRGRGPRPTEFYLGADGIFELQLTIGMRTESKSILFQAKMDRKGGRDLLEQAVKLSTWREAAFVTNYSRDGFAAVTLDQVIRERGGAPSFHDARPLAAYLGEEFLNCVTGDDELRYDASARRLMWRAENGEIVATQFNVKHRMRIRVQAPRAGDNVPGVDREISPVDLHRYRMAATADEILGLTSPPASSSLKEARRQLVQAYHPDRFGELDRFFRELMTRRTQEVNAAYDLLKPKKK
jgi:hypothetical protein